MSAAGLSSTVWRLAFPDVPAAGESLTSWLDRLAVDHVLTRKRLLRTVGLIATTDEFPQWFGIDLTDDQQRRLAAATGVDDCDPMLLGRSPAVEFSPEARDRYTTASRWSSAQWVRPYASWLCPHCLAEDGYWRRDWHLPWVPVCLRHRCYLVGVCPACGQAPSRRVSGIPHLTTCLAPHPDKTSSIDGRQLARSRRRSVCGADLTAAPTQPVHDAALIDLCTQIQAALDGGDSAAFGGFADLRSLTVLALQMAGAHMIADADPCVREAFDAHAGERDDTAPRQGAAGRRAYRSYRQTPTDPHLTAAALRAAEPLARPGDERAVLAAFVDAVGAPPPRWTHVRKFWTPPQRLQPHLDPVLLRHRRGEGWYSDGRSCHKLAATTQPLGAGAVPQLLWPEATAWVCARIPQLAEGWRRSAPRVLAAMLARRCQPQLSSWGAVCEELGMRADNQSVIRRRFAALRKEGTLERAEECVRTISARLAGRADRIDYRARRDALARFDVDDDTWAALRREARVPTTVRTRAWRPRVGAWIWCLLTGGDFHFAPSLGLADLERQARRAATNAYVVYFCGNALPGIEPVLRDYAADVLAAHGLAGALEMTWDSGAFGP